MDTSVFRPQQGKPRPKVTVNDSILESLRSLSGGIGKSIAKDFAGKGGSDALKSLFGSLPQQGELKPNQSVDLGQERQPMPFVRRPEVMERPPVVRGEEIGLKEKIEAVRAELAGVSKSLRNLESETQKAIAEVPVHPGVYHLNFFERLRSILKILRQQIEDSRTWLALFTERKKKIGYWGLYKKHGTKFGLSSERTIATQAG